MVTFSDNRIPNIFRYKVSGFSGDQQEKSQIEYPYIISELATATGSQPLPSLEYLFLRLTVDSVPALVSVSATNHYKILLTVVVNTSAGGPGIWFGL